MRALARGKTEALDDLFAARLSKTVDVINTKNIIYLFSDIFRHF
jgi:hypothetical protein